MIPYEDLVAALERWRVRNGLPVSGGGVPAPSVSASTGPTPMTAPIAAPRSAPAAPPPKSMYGVPVTPMNVPGAKVPERPDTDEPLGLDDADVLDEDLLEPEGGDFAMGFGVSSGKGPEYEEDASGERTEVR